MASSQRPKGEILAWTYLKPFECPDCGGKGVVEHGHVSVAHNVSRCQTAKRIRMRYPHLSKVRG